MSTRYPPLPLPGSPDYDGSRYGNMTPIDTNRTMELCTQTEMDQYVRDITYPFSIAMGMRDSYRTAMEQKLERAREFLRTRAAYHPEWIVRKVAA